MPVLVIPVFTVSTLLWLVTSILIGVLYAGLLYKTKSTLSKKDSKLLFLVRALAVACIAFLLGAPLFKSVTKTLEKPLIIIAQDNSASIEIAKAKNFNLKEYLRDLKAVEKEISKDYEVVNYTFGETVKKSGNNNFKDKTTNISSVFTEINRRYSGRNIGSIILATDGIYNKGGTPEVELSKIKSAVYTISLGDTVPKRDILIANANYNSVVFTGNRFEIGVEIEAYRAKGSTAKLTVSDRFGQSVTEIITITSNDFRQTIPVILDASQKGLTGIYLKLSTISNELSAANNSKTIFVDVVDGKKKVLILANSPHPDISAIKQSLESDKNYEVKVVMREVKPDDLNQAALIVLHQIPSLTFSISPYSSYLNKKPLWLILGSESNVNAIANHQNILKLNTSLQEESFPELNVQFYSFTVSDLLQEHLKSFPPLISPRGDYSFAGSTNSILLWQKNKKPLFAFQDNSEQRVGILAGEGIWRWKLDEFEKFNTHEGVDELVKKTVQYLTSKNEKQKFKAYPAENVFDEGEKILLAAELYNESFEPVNQPDVSIILKSTKNKSYSYLFTRTERAYNLDAGVLPSGEYNFIAKTKLGEKEYVSSGRFNIVRQDIEYANSTANHRLLFSIAKETGGEMITPDQMETLPDLIKRNELVKTIAYEDKSYKEPIDFKFLFFLILGLLSLEWFARKRAGEV